MRATSTSSHKKIGCLIVFLALMAAALLPLHNPLRTEVKNLYCDRCCGLLSEVREWEQRFGKPQELADEDLEGFIYWPKDGMAALAGYLYEAQGRRVKNLSDRKVTSILIPCKRRVPLSSFDIYIEGHLEFSSTPADKFPNSRIAIACTDEYRSLFLFAGEIDSDEIWLSNMPHFLLGQSAVIIHFDNGRPAVVEILESNILTWYD